MTLATNDPLQRSLANSRVAFLIGKLLPLKRRIQIRARKLLWRRLSTVRCSERIGPRFALAAAEQALAEGDIATARKLIDTDLDGAHQADLSNQCAAVRAVVNELLLPKTGSATSASVEFDWQSVAVTSAATGEVDPWCTLFQYLPADHFMFSSQTVEPRDLNHSHWKWQRLPIANGDPRLAARWIKTHLHQVLPAEKRWAVWVDSNILGAQTWANLFVDFVKSGNPIGLIPHPSHQTLWDEVSAIRRLGKENPFALRAALNSIKFNSEAEVWETGVMFLDLRHPKIATLCRQWWLSQERGVPRDQISLPGLLHAQQITVHEILQKGASARNDPRFGLLPSWRLDKSQFFHPANTHDQVLEKKPPKQSPVSGTSRNKEGGEFRVDIVVPIHNALGAVRNCLASILANLSEVKANLILVNDGSNKETSDYLRNLRRNCPEITLLENGSNLGYTISVNRGLREASAPFAIVVNSDVTVSSGWIEGLISPMLSNRWVGCVGPVSNAAGFQSIPRSKPTWLERLRYQSAVNSPKKATYTCGIGSDADYRETIFVPFLHGFCFAVRTKALANVGLLDEEIFPRGYGEDIDFSFRLTDHGWLNAVAPRVYLAHQKSASFTGRERGTLMREGRRKLRKKHGLLRVRNTSAMMKSVNETVLEMALS